MPKADRSSALVPACPGVRPLPGHRGAPAAGQRAFAQAGGLVGGRRAGQPARGRAATAARSARVPMSRVPMSLAPSARTSEHRRYSPDQGALGGLPAGDRAHTGRCGQTNGKAIGTLPGTPVYRPPGGRSGAAARGQRNRAGLVAPGGTKTVFAAAPRPRSGQHGRNIGARRAPRRNSRGTGVSGLRTCNGPGRAITRRQPHPASHAATRTQPPRIGNIGLQTANVLRYRRDQVP